MEFLHIVYSCYTKQDKGLFAGLKRNIEYLRKKVESVFCLVFKKYANKTKINRLKLTEGLGFIRLTANYSWLPPSNLIILRHEPLLQLQVLHL